MEQATWTLYTASERDSHLCCTIFNMGRKKKHGQNSSRGQLPTPKSTQLIRSRPIFLPLAKQIHMGRCMLKCLIIDPDPDQPIPNVYEIVKMVQTSFPLASDQTVCLETKNLDLMTIEAGHENRSPVTCSRGH